MNPTDNTAGGSSLGFIEDKVAAWIKACPELIPQLTSPTDRTVIRILDGLFGDRKFLALVKSSISRVATAARDNLSRTAIHSDPERSSRTSTTAGNRDSRTTEDGSASAVPNASQQASAGFGAAQDTLKSLSSPTASSSTKYWALKKDSAFIPPWNTATYILDRGPLEQFVRSIVWAPGDDGSQWRLLCRVDESDKDGRMVSPCIAKLPNEDEYSMVFARSSKGCVQLDCRPLEVPNLVIRAENIVDDPVSRKTASSATAAEPSYPHVVTVPCYPMQQQAAGAPNTSPSIVSGTCPTAGALGVSSARAGSAPPLASSSISYSGYRTQRNRNSASSHWQTYGTGLQSPASVPATRYGCATSSPLSQPPYAATNTRDPAYLMRTQAPALTPLLQPIAEKTGLVATAFSLATSACPSGPSPDATAVHTTFDVIDKTYPLDAAQVHSLPGVFASVHSRKRQRRMSDTGSELELENAFHAYINKEPTVSAGAVAAEAQVVTVDVAKENKAGVAAAAAKEEEEEEEEKEGDVRPAGGNAASREDTEDVDPLSIDKRTGEDDSVGPAKVLSAKSQSQESLVGDAEGLDDAEVVKLLTDRKGSSSPRKSPTKAYMARADTENDSPIPALTSVTPRKSPKKVVSRERIRTRSVAREMNLRVLSPRK